MITKNLSITLKQRFPSINSSTLVLVRRGKRVATLQGEITFPKGLRIAVKERLSFDEGPVMIEELLKSQENEKGKK